MSQSKMLEGIYVALVLMIARQIKLEKAEGGTGTTSDCIDEAIKEIHQKASRVLKLRSRAL